MGQLDARQEVLMSSFNPAQIPATTARRTVRSQPLAQPRGASAALFGAGLTVLAVVASLWAFAAI